MKHVALSVVIALLPLPACAAPPASDSKPILRVAVYDDTGAGPSKNDLIRALSTIPNTKVQTLTAKQIRGGALEKIDVLCQPGGSGGGQGRRLGEDGRDAIRSFVKGGGGYLGFCAGAYLASNDYTWSLNLLDAKVVDKPHWARGIGTVRIGLTDTGRKILHAPNPRATIYFGNGPLLYPSNDPELPDYQPLALYETEIATHGAPSGVMIGATAIASAPFGQGRVLCFSSHPEKTPGLETFVHRAVFWAAGRKP